MLRVPDECAYYKEDAGKMLLGAFEPKAKPWGMDGIPEDFCFDQFPEDFDHFEPILERAVRRMPLLETAGIHTFFNGPESFTPDDRYYLGEAPELAGYWVAAGYNSIGIVSSGGAGFALAQWMHDGEPPFDLWEVDIRRAQPFQRNRRYLKERVSETLGLLYADHFPYRQFETARGVRRSPIHEHLKARGAVFGEVAGWERANWFAREGQEREYRYDWKRQNWFENQREEHLAVRNGVGLFDMTSFGKIRVEGRDALRFLQRVCANQIDVPPGRIVYTQMLNRHGGIESDLTVTRLSEAAFLIVVPGATLHRDLAWLRKNLAPEEFAVITDVTASEAVLVLMGPRAREVMSRISPQDFSNEAFPFGTAQEIEIGMGLARAHRVTYVGELGWELYVTSDQAAHVFEALEEAGAASGLQAVWSSCARFLPDREGLPAFRARHHRRGPRARGGARLRGEDGEGRLHRPRRRAAEARGGAEAQADPVQALDPDPMLFHNEAVVRDGKIVSIITSGNYGHYLGARRRPRLRALRGGKRGGSLASAYEIEISGERFPAEASLKPMYDPKAERPRL